MIRLLYLSQANPSSADDLESILRTARQNNPPLSITGVLVHGGGWYMQLIEGPERSVLKLYAKIIDDSPGLTPLEFRAKARRLKQQHDIKCIMIDYMQLMDNPGVESRQQQISEISRSIKAVAREISVPVIALSQLNRGSENRDGHRPRMSDLRESGSIEQDADVICLLHREDYYRQTEPDFVPDNIAEIIVAKQRNGPTGTVKLTFDNKTTTFKNLASQVDAI